MRYYIGALVGISLVRAGEWLARGLGRLPPRFRWTLHNLVGHPVREVLYQVGCKDLGKAVTYATTPMPAFVTELERPPGRGDRKELPLIGMWRPFRPEGP